VKLVDNPDILSYMLPGHLLLVGSLAKFYADADTEFSSIPPYTFTIRVALLVIKPLVRYRTDGADGHFVGGIRATTNTFCRLCRRSTTCDPVFSRIRAQ
jgi:hypothetical protein